MRSENATDKIRGWSNEVLIDGKWTEVEPEEIVPGTHYRKVINGEIVLEAICYKSVTIHNVHKNLFFS